MPTALSVNLNKIALLRNSREGNYPDVVAFAKQAIAAGAQGITVHPRPDQRHIRPHDVQSLSELTSNLPHCEFNIEGNPLEGEKAFSRGDIYPGFMSLIEKYRPDQATLVPDSNEQLTSDHGFDLRQDTSSLESILQQLRDWGVRSSLFMDPDIEQIDRAKAIGADRIELYTGPYAASYNTKQHETIIERYRAAARHANAIGLTVNAGHDLNQQNLASFLSIAEIAEVSIGHALTVEALEQGYSNTISAYSNICRLG